MFAARSGLEQPLTQSFEDFAPTVFYTKRMLQVFAEEHKVALFCDFAATPAKGMCSCMAVPTLRPPLRCATQTLLRKCCLYGFHHQHTSFLADCHFSMDKSKEAAAPEVVSKEFRIMESHTTDANFFGPTAFGPYQEYLHAPLWELTR